MRYELTNHEWDVIDPHASEQASVPSLALILTTRRTLCGHPFAFAAPAGSSDRRRRACSRH